MLPKLNVTLVGCGHYAKDLIYPKYKEHPGFDVKATISPNSVIEGILAFKTEKEWQAEFGSPKENDIFDMCIFADNLVFMVDNLALIGAKNFIYPKPIAETYNQLKTLIAQLHVYQLKIAVASQWYYDYDLINSLKDAHDVAFCFNYVDEKIGYNYFNRFLPHAIQLSYSAGITSWTYESEKGVKEIRTVTIKSNLKNVKLKYDLSKRGDLLKKMIDGFYKTFMEHSEYNLGIGYYFPIAERYLEIKERFK